ncbi:MAG: hypothetical protein ACFFFH_04970 [Candidatus Thorarchaeota archaeon]
MIFNSYQVKPIVFVGKYHDVVETLLQKHVNLLKPKVIWIEYRTIPILSIARSFSNFQFFEQIYFLEIKTFDILSQLLQSRALPTIYQEAFSTLIIDVPLYFSFPIDFHVRFQELMRRITIILIMDELVLPQTQINLIRVEKKCSSN